MVPALVARYPKGPVLLQIGSREQQPLEKMSKKSFSKRVVRTFRPLIFGESFEDFAETALLFPDFKLKNVFVLICVFIWLSHSMDFSTS